MEAFTRDELNLVHASSLEILEKTGVIMQCNEILDLFNKAGAIVNRKEKTVKIPSGLVQEFLGKIPKHVTLYSRDGKTRIELGRKEKQYFTTGGAIPFILDRNGERRTATTRDVVDRIRLIDASKNISHIETSPGIWPQDVPEYIRDVFVTRLAFENTEKHYGLETIGTAKAHEYCIRMAEIVAGGKEELRKQPIIHASAEPIGPLLWDEHALRNLSLYARHGLLVDVLSFGAAGLTSPATLIGAIVHGNAGFLAGVVAAQLVNEGTPVGRFASGASSDVHTGRITMGSVEAAVFEIATGQIAQFYGLPSMGLGGIPETNTLDMQSGYETALTMIFAALGGINRIQTGGLLATATISSLEKMVIDDEIIGMVRHALRGIEVSEEKIGMDLIHEVGPKGNFMQGRKNLEFARKNLRTEFFVPNLSLRLDWEKWINTKRKTVVTNAQEKVKTILTSHEPPSLPDDTRMDLRKVLEEAKKDLERQ